MSIMENLGQGQKGTASPRRVVIVDFNHLAYKYVHGMQTRLTREIVDPNGGGLKTITTNIPNGISKALHRWTRGGYDIPAICLDRPNTARRQMMEHLRPETATGYKGSRGGMSPDMKESIELTVRLFRNAGVACYAGMNYEADDLIKAVIDRCKIDYKGMPIDVVTGDADMLPLVDDQVSVFLSSKTGTYATAKDIEKTKYKQVTPETYSEIASALSAYKSSKIEVPYNSVLLIKMLRGDSSDNVPGVSSKSIPPRRVKTILEGMAQFGVDLGDTFRYGGDEDAMVASLVPFILEEGIVQDLINADKVATVRTELFDSNYNFTQYAKSLGERIGGGKDGFGGLVDLSEIMKNFVIMDLNRGYTLSDGTVLREPARLKSGPVPYNEVDLAESFSELGIKIPVGSI